MVVMEGTGLHQRGAPGAWGFQHRAVDLGAGAPQIREDDLLKKLDLPKALQRLQESQPGSAQPRQAAQRRRLLPAQATHHDPFRVSSVMKLEFS